MSQTIDTAFVKQFESDVHLAYQRMGPKLRGMVRFKEVSAEDTTFQKVGKGSAGAKDRHGLVPIMNLSHTNVAVTPVDRYAGEYIDKLDLLKTNIDERNIAATSIAAALGRVVDQFIVDAMDAGANETTATGGMTLAKVLEAWEYFGTNDVPDDGQRFAAVSPAAWSDMLQLDEFAHADYVGLDELPYKGGMTAKRWMGYLWFTHSGLTVASSVRKCNTWHRSAVGYGENSPVYLDVTWDGSRQSWLAVGGLSCGATLIDETGFYRIRVTE